ncbi:RNA ligase family protein [Ohtaekwangia koreensis]|uniref:RNA ligase n=1 Tax=Ohtaekwangia koreensis TaxID=688867 RepID=A0A1T5L8G7_9BACT|nr:RNA ligase family protein [Ohtaekwangia koreensis]SKC72317.1 RNA ligase [Ohtaekwangia koreensis]
MKQIFTDATEVCMYGEGYGNKIQKEDNRYIAHRTDFILFDVKVGNFWLSRENVEDIANKLKIDIVPIIGTGTLLEAVEFVKKG